MLSLIGWAIVLLICTYNVSSSSDELKLVVDVLSAESLAVLVTDSKIDEDKAIQRVVITCSTCESSMSIPKIGATIDAFLTPRPWFFIKRYTLYPPYTRYKLYTL